jgi:hypothetical protein
LAIQVAIQNAPFKAIQEASLIYPLYILVCTLGIDLGGCGPGRVTRQKKGEKNGNLFITHISIFSLYFHFFFISSFSLYLQFSLFISILSLAQVGTRCHAMSEKLLEVVWVLQGLEAN